MTAEQLEELLGKVTPWPPVSGHETAHDEALIALAPSHARRVLAAEKLVEALEQCRDELMSAYHSEFDGVWLESDFKEVAGKYDAALTAYREASK